MGSKETEEDNQGDNFIVVGSNHANRLVHALRAIGELVTSLADPKWRLTEDSAKVLAAQLKSAVAANPAAMVIFWIFDSSVFYSSTAPLPEISATEGG